MPFPSYRKSMRQGSGIWKSCAFMCAMLWRTVKGWSGKQACLSVRQGGTEIGKCKRNWPWRNGYQARTSQLFVFEESPFETLPFVLGFSRRATLISPVQNSYLYSRPLIAMPVKQSASKEDFLKALGLNVALPDDKRRLQQMWVSWRISQGDLK